MTAYRRSQVKMGAIDTPTMQTVVEFINAVELSTFPASKETIENFVDCIRQITLESDAPHIAAAKRLVAVWDSKARVDLKDAKALLPAFYAVFGGADPSELWGNHIGLCKPVGRQTQHGFTTSDTVSAYIELRIREFIETAKKDGSTGRGALAAAIRDAAAAFRYQGDPESIESAIKRDWRIGRGTVAVLSDADLREIIAPYKVSP